MVPAQTKACHPLKMIQKKQYYQWGFVLAAQTQLMW